MVRPRVHVCTSEILEIFWMGKIIVYMVHTEAPQRLISFIPTPPGNGQYQYLPYRKSFLLYQNKGNEVISIESVISLK